MRVGVSMIFMSSCLNLFFMFFSWLTPQKSGPRMWRTFCMWNERKKRKQSISKPLSSCADGFAAQTYFALSSLSPPPSPGPVIQPFPFLLKQSAIYKQTNFMKSVTYLLSAMKTANTSPNAWALSKYTVLAREIWIISHMITLISYYNYVL